MTTLAIGLILGGFAGWFLNSWARGNKLWMHRWNRTRQFSNARREIARGIDV
jgi:membrane protein YqaA with SNARE-associated domain